MDQPNKSAPVSNTAMTPAAKKQNPWLIISIVLAIALFFAIGLNISTASKNKELVKNVLPLEEATDQLVNFINEVYGFQLGPVTLKESVEENGMYKITLSIVDQATGQLVEQVVYVTRDAQVFIPQIIRLEDMRGQLDQLKQQQNAAPNPIVPPPPAEDLEEDENPDEELE